MPKNNMDTIFNTLDNIARKKELTRSDEKEIRRQLSSLLTEMANTSDKTLKTEYLDKYNKLKENHADALKAAEDTLNEEQKASLAEIMQKSEDNKARVEENKERVEETNLNSNVRENTSAPAPQPEKVEENKAEETKTEETKTEENNASNADNLPPPIDLSVLNKDPAELTEADKQILQNIINSEYTTDTAKANARILSEGKPLPDTATPGAPAPAMDMSVLNASPYEISAEGRETLQNIINSPHTTDIAKENAAKLMADADKAAENIGWIKGRLQDITNNPNADNRLLRGEIQAAASLLADEMVNGYKLHVEDANLFSAAISRLPEDQRREISASVNTIFRNAIQTRLNANQANQSNTSQQNAQANDAPANDAPQQDAPANNAQANDAPQQDAPANNAQANDAQGNGAQVNDAPAPDAPQPEPPLTEGEINKYLDEVRSSGNWNAYIAGINPKLSPANIEASMALGPTYDLAVTNNDGSHPIKKTKTNGKEVEETAEYNRATALANPDDMMVAVDYYEQNGKFDEIAGTIAAHLQQYNISDLTPDNAYMLLAMADKIKDNPQFADIYKEFSAKLATALRDYDVQNMGKLTEEQLLKNYNEAHESLAAFVPIDAKGKPTIEGYTFTNDSGEPLEDKWHHKLLINKNQNKTRNQKAVLKMARELAAQELAKTGLEKDPKKRSEQLNKIMNEKIEMLLHSPDGKKTFNQTELAARMAAGHTSAETFRNRAQQRFKGSKLGQAVTTRLQQLDKDLTNLYGAKYTKAKKVTKTIAKIGLSTIKSQALFAVASLANPVGIPALIALNTCKQWKAMKNQLKDPSISKGKKIAMVLGAGVTTTLGMATAATGLDGVLNAMGANTPAILQFATNAGSVLGVAGRTAVSTAAMIVPNMVEKMSLKSQKKALEAEMANLGPDGRPTLATINKHKDSIKALDDKIAAIQNGNGLGHVFKNFIGHNQRKLKKLEAQKEQLKNNPPRDMAAINAEMKKLETKQKKNKNELITKSLNSAVGIGLANSGLIPSIGEWVSEKANNAADTVSEAAGDVVDKVTEVVRGEPDMVEGRIPSELEQKAYEAAYRQNLPEDTFNSPDNKGSIYQPGYDLTPEGMAQDAADRAILAEYKAQTGHDFDMEAYEEKYNPGMPDETSARLSEEIMAKNLEAAKAENSSGIEGKSTFAHTLSHLESLGDSRISDTNAMAEDLCEHLGAKANQATIACKMAPYALQEALDLEGLPNDKPTSYNMIKYLSEHELTPEQQTALDSFIEKNFDGARFKTENFADYNRPSREDLLAEIGKGVKQNIADDARYDILNADLSQEAPVRTWRYDQIEPQPVQQSGVSITTGDHSPVNVEIHQAQQQPATNTGQVYMTEAPVNNSVLYADMYTDNYSYQVRDGELFIRDPHLSRDLSVKYSGAYVSTVDGTVLYASASRYEPDKWASDIRTAEFERSRDTSAYDRSGDREWLRDNARDMGYGTYPVGRSIYGNGTITYVGENYNSIYDRVDQNSARNYMANNTLGTIRHGTVAARDVIATIGMAKDMLGR